MLREKVLERCRRVMDSRPPDELVGNQDCPLIRRWFLYKTTHFGRVYLHQLMRSDDDRALHDHKMSNISWILDGSYREWMEWERDKIDEKNARLETIEGTTRIYVRHTRIAGDVIARGAGTPHRLELDTPVISLFFGGPIVRDWGFHTASGWVRWRDFLDLNGRSGC